MGACLAEMKVLTSEIYHETNTFSSRSTDLKAFRNRLLLFKGDAVSERGSANTELDGYVAESVAIESWPGFYVPEKTMTGRLIMLSALQPVQAAK